MANDSYMLGLLAYIVKVSNRLSKSGLLLILIFIWSIIIFHSIKSFLVLCAQSNRHVYVCEV